MRKWSLLVLLLTLLFVLSACGDKAEETSSGSKENAGEKKKEEKPKEWPYSFQFTDKAFEFPSSLKEAEETTQGKWWEKVEDGELKDSDKEKIVEAIAKIDKRDESEEIRAENIKRLFFETFHPELPGLATFEPREKISLEELNTGSGLKLNGQEVKENINVAIILDASGSMKAKQDGKSQMEIAKESINEFVSNLPEKTKVSLTIYGHEGSSSDADKAKSCKSIKEIYPLKSYSEDEFNKALSGVDPKGWTPIAASLTQAGKTLQGLNADNNTNVIYLVSDGEETCDGDPAKVAKELAQSNIKPIINVIGFAVGADQRDQLEEIAEHANGRYIQADNQQDLEEEFQKSNDAIGKWIDWHNQHIGAAIDQDNEDSGDLIDLDNKTMGRLIDFDNMVTGLLIDADNKHDLDPDVYDLVNEAIDDFYNKMSDDADEHYNTKKEMIDNAYNEAKEKIDETYQKNTD
ncbi:hypothetical protein JOC86_001477 [Bacillus pakistanensis]|uniref:VWFA domain-containing protein n=1 Tax=Rossellomorea pakistanensis TaxID=992288 RepID=A0ABS2NAW0_9BACI|nr:VWA domain-containing protein [Bacillus pakistanensis]MBM7584940.1 hypothetical protein [Bacillus pakistanensis]